MMRLSVIIPAYNEAERLPRTLRDAHAWLIEHLHADFEILVADDGSTDATCEKVRELLPHLPHCRLLPGERNQGKGAAVRRGMQSAKGAVRLFMDADHSTHIREIRKVFPAMERGADVVIASRQHPESDIARHQSWLREHMGMTFNLLMRGIVDLRFPDTQCGFKAFTTAAAEAIFSRARLDGFSFDVELLYLAQRMHMEIVEIPVQWINQENSRVRMLTDPARMFLDILRIRRLHRHTEFPKS